MSMRISIYVKDLARSFLLGLEKFYLMKQNVFNVGSDNLNSSKEEIANVVA